MLIKYLKDAHNASIGDVAEVPSDQARVLIILGMAEPAPSKKKNSKVRTSDAKADDEII